LLRQETNGLVTYQFESLAAEGLVHAVFTRIGGASHGPFATLNVGNSVGDDEAAVAENHRRIYAHMSVSAKEVVTARQVHGNHIATAEAGDGGQVMPNADGLVTGEPGLALLLRFADCQPILLYDPIHCALGLVHAGWRGIAQGVVLRAVEKMQETFDSRPSDLMAGLGPAIGPCCYAVGHDVANAMGYALPDWRKVMSPLDENSWHLDLPAANTQQLSAAGVRAIEQAALCTACHNDEFFSHRADQGVTGRFAVMARLPDSIPADGPNAPADATLEQAPHQHEGREIEPRSLLPPGFPSFDQGSEGGR
jgi:YfiH family protein